MTATQFRKKTVETEFHKLDRRRHIVLIKLNSCRYCCYSYQQLMHMTFYTQEPGSLLGFKEFGINFQRIKEGLDRTRINAELKDDIQKESEKLGRKK